MFEMPGSWPGDTKQSWSFSRVPDKKMRPVPTDERVVIAVMGVTGAGKSSLIKLITGNKNITVGETLHSETSEISGYEFTHKGKTYIMIDTPGFDDTCRKDSEITEMILTWLKDSLLSGQRLNGVIYLHRITDVRMGGSALRNQRMFRKLVGEDAFPNVVLAMSFWEQIPEQVAIKRESELRRVRDFWGGMLEKGAKMVRLKHDRGQALSLLEQISRQGKVVLDAQDEMVNQGRSVSDTSAAREQKEEAERLRRLLQEQRAEQRRQMERQLELENERKAREMEEMLEMQRQLEAEREAMELATRLSLIEAEKQYERERREMEAEQRRQEEQRQRDLEAIERRKREEAEEERQRAYERRRQFQRDYQCVENKPIWACDKCGGKVTRSSYYYHCCFCDSDRYFHCYSCGADCGEPTHPSMGLFESPDSCIVM